ncbi:UDP-N-acetylglucosamine--N-acetylmuramyl-(pentapeptide) pyrophosphoryl-undecaprenol N-acetylglucosamine transferase [Candidatus Roizmanbacteria bacterium]|nr:UDP-N-acetylglucosamine--N-acetylmuramyl-(pentapeptide) pyrophosphoryl-undecaprenol N-acetylglucosamine transferase [Candidatus Roizmanbacteria bacterium]
MKLLVTGGHISPALAFIDEFVERNNRIVFVGRKYSNERDRSITFEYREVQKRKIPFQHIKTGRFTRILSFRNLSNLLFIPVGFLQSFYILRKEKPDAILTFGGYIAFPVAIIGWFMKIPLYTHEQTIHPGMTNRVVGMFARKVFISFEDSKRYFPSHKIVYSGNPIRGEIFKTLDIPFPVSQIKQTIYITGGSLGAHSINVHIKNILPQLLEKYTVIHQTGNVAEYNDHQQLLALRSQLPEDLKQRYFLREHFSSSEIGYVYSIADIVVGRCGANTFFELIALKKPSVIVPLPWSAYGEQEKQAQLLQSAGVAEIFHQSEESAKLLAIIAKMIDNKEAHTAHFDKLNSLYKKNAAEIISQTILASQ